MTHKDICIPIFINRSCELGKVYRYEAVGFLREGEEKISVEHAIRRAGGKDVVVGDLSIISNEQHHLPIGILAFERLITAAPDPVHGRSDHMKSLIRDGNHWGLSSYGKDLPPNFCGRESLVLRRVVCCCQNPIAFVTGK